MPALITGDLKGFSKTYSLHAENKCGYKSVLTIKDCTEFLELEPGSYLLTKWSNQYSEQYKVKMSVKHNVRIYDIT